MMTEAGRLPPRWAAIAAALMMIVCGCDAFSAGGGMGVKGSRASKQASCGGTLMQLREGGDEGNSESNRRQLLAGAFSFGSSLLLGQQAAHADILDVVTGNQKQQDVLARLKIGKVYIPTLSCTNKTQACWDDSKDQWFDYPRDVSSGYTLTPSGVRIKDLAPRTALKELVKTSPLPNEAEGTDNVQVFFASYVVGGASDAELTAFYDPLNSKGKYYDVENRDPRLFQMGSVLINVVKSNLVPGLAQGLVGMRIGSRRSIYIPAALAYGQKGTAAKSFYRTVPPNSDILINLEIKKVVR